MQNRSDTFNAVMEPITSAYMTWDLKRPIKGHIEIEEGPPPLSRKTKDRRVHACTRYILFVFFISPQFLFNNKILGCFYTTPQQFTSEDCIPAILVKQGVVPCAPYFPELLISVRTLELFHTTYLCCPRLSLQAFLRILCDLNNIPYQPYMHQQFTVCYDLYISILPTSGGVY